LDNNSVQEMVTMSDSGHETGLGLDDDIVTHYPLPIAQEYDQLLEMQTWWDKCQQLRDVLDFSLRYCALIAVSDYLGGQLDRRDPELDESLPSKLIEPTLDDLYEMLLGVMTVYHQTDSNLLMVPELYDFCCDGTGALTTKMQEIRYLIDGFVEELKRLGPGDEEQMQEQYVHWEPHMKSVLANLSFLKHYQLLRIYRSEDLGGHEWRMRVLMGTEIDTEAQPWEKLIAPERPGVALWDGARQKLLMLYPFALFDKSEKYTQAFYSLAEELYLYDRAREARVIYVGLWKPHGLLHRMRMPTERTLADLRDLLGQGNWPRVDEVRPPKPKEPVRVLDWRTLRGLAASQSQGQLERYRKEKYRTELYLQREMVEGDFRAFLESDKNAFLVVGDSGTGKTNLLCHWVKETLEKKDDVVLFYNCRELPTGEDLNLGNVVASRLKQRDFGALLAKLEHERAERGGRFLFVLDGLNEHQPPLTLLNSLAQDVLSEVPAGVYDWFKVVVSCRTEAWRSLERHFREVGLFYHTADGIGVRLPQFTAEELPAVYEKYREKHELQTAFGELSEATKRFIADPLMLKFVAESSVGKPVPPDPRTADVFDRYFKEKVGDRDDPEMDRQEKEVVARLVELMYQAKRDELSERELEDDEVIGQAVLAPQDVRSPYFRLVDKGVLTQVQVERAGPAAAGLFGGPSVSSDTRVRFTYDRFFEHLLAFYVMPGEVTVERLKELTAEATRDRFASLWGAVKTRLIVHTEKVTEALTSTGVLAALAQEGEPEGEKVSTIIHKASDRDAPAVAFQVRGMMVDTLVSYGALQPERLQRFLTHVLLQLDSESAGMVAVFAAYKLRMLAVFDSAYHHPSPIVRQAAIHHTYFFWSRYREPGERFMDELTRKASDEVKGSVLREAFRKLSGEEIDLSRLPTLSAFLGTTLLISGHLLTEPQAVSRFAKNLLGFYNSFGPAKGIMASIVKRWAGDAAMEGWRSGGIINLDTLAVFTDRPLGDVRRREVKEYAPYMGVVPYQLEDIEGRLLQWSRLGDGVISLVLNAILVNRTIHEPEATLALLKRMFYEGNTMSQYNVLRAMSSALQREIEPCPGYLEFFNEALLDTWTGTERTTEVLGRVYTLGHLAWALAFECQGRAHGRIQFVDRLLALPWQGDKLSRLVGVIDRLGMMMFLVFRMTGSKPYPVLETLSQWFHLEGVSPEEQAKVRNALGQALARIWRVYPSEVEHFLENEPELIMRMFEAIHGESHWELTNLAGQGSITSIVLLPGALPGLVEVLQQICDEVTDVEEGVRMIGSYFVDPGTLEQILRSIEDE
jgi:hypothetical protein